MTLAWKDAYRFGHDEIDAARRSVFSAAFKLAAHQNVVAARAAIVQIKQYSASMFAREERIMQSMQYKARDLHAGHHHVLTKHMNHLILSGLESSNAKAERDFIVKVASVMEMWIFNHFMREDPKVRQLLTTSHRALALLG